jgi:putative addiction module killer protein
VALTVREYLTAGGKSPFREWLGSLTKAVAARIQARVLRFELGNLGDHKNVGDGVWEARVMFGPGYRIYFGKDGDSIIMLLAGGDKGSQTKDIARAQVFWRDFLETKRHGKAKSRLERRAG